MILFEDIFNLGQEWLPGFKLQRKYIESNNIQKNMINYQYRLISLLTFNCL